MLDGFVCLRHDGRQHNIRLSRRLRPDLDHYGVGPLRIEIVEPMQTLRFVLEDNDFGIACDVLCHSTVLPYEDPVEVTRVDGRLLSERATYEMVGACEGWVEVAGRRHELTPDALVVLPQPLVGQPGRTRRARATGRPDRRAGSPACGSGCCSAPSTTAASTSSTRAGGRRRARAPSSTPTVGPVTGVEHELDFYEGGRRVRGGTFRLTDAEGEERTYSFGDLGWVYCQGGGYFGGFDDGLGQGVYRGDYHVEGEVWDVTHPTRIVDEAGKSFEFDHDWAESFVRLRRGRTGAAHFECVVIRPGAPGTSS